MLLAQSTQSLGLNVNWQPVWPWNYAEGAIDISSLLQASTVWLQLIQALTQYIQLEQQLPQHCSSNKACELWNWSSIIPTTLDFFFFPPVTH